MKYTHTKNPTAFDLNNSLRTWIVADILVFDWLMY